MKRAQMPSSPSPAQGVRRTSSQISGAAVDSSVANIGHLKEELQFCFGIPKPAKRYRTPPAPPVPPPLPPKKEDPVVPPGCVKCPRGHIYHARDRCLGFTDCKVCMSSLSEVHHFIMEKRGVLLTKYVDRKLAKKKEALVEIQCERRHKPFELPIKAVLGGREWCNLCQFGSLKDQQAALLGKAKMSFIERQTGVKAEKVKAAIDLLRKRAEGEAEQGKELSLTTEQCLLISILMDDRLFGVNASSLCKEKGWALVSLGVEVEAKDTISVYRKAARIIHPDKCKHDKASEAFQRLAKIYEHKK